MTGGVQQGCLEGMPGLGTEGGEFSGRQFIAGRESGACQGLEERASSLPRRAGVMGTVGLPASLMFLAE